MGKDNVPVVAMLGRVSEVQAHFIGGLLNGKTTVPSVRGSQAGSRNVWYQSHEEIGGQGCYQ